MINEEFWKLTDMQQQHEKELEAISEIFLQNKDGSSIRALYLMCKRIDRDFQLPEKPDCKYTELVREAACILIDALTLYAAKMNIDLKRDLETLEITEHASQTRVIITRTHGAIKWSYKHEDEF